MGEDLAIGLLTGFDAEAVSLLAPPLPRPVHTLRLGKMWAQPHDEGWRLLERLSPAWTQA